MRRVPVLFLPTCHASNSLSGFTSWHIPHSLTFGGSNPPFITGTPSRTSTAIPVFPSCVPAHRLAACPDRLPPLRRLPTADTVDSRGSGTRRPAARPPAAAGQGRGCYAPRQRTSGRPGRTSAHLLAQRRGGGGGPRPGDVYIFLIPGVPHAQRPHGPRQRPPPP